MVQPLPGAAGTDPGTTLAAHLRTLAASPRDFHALMGAGQAALDVGDPNAAVGFFARAEEQAPRDGRAKAGLATALVQLEKADDALRLFGEAVALGVREDEIARDRGLAYDLRGEPRRAQEDYVRSLRHRADDETTRRYALSLGISGEKAKALDVLDPLLRRQDQGAWRARAFILAMNGDVAGANSVARQVMPAALASSMIPFLSRLARLDAADRAHAVNFGTMPSDGTAYAQVRETDAPFAPPAAPPRRAAARTAQVDRSATTPAMKPVDIPRAATPASDMLAPAGAPLGRMTEPARLDQRVGARIAPIDPTRLPPEARGDPTGPVKIVQMTQLPPPDAARAAPLRSSAPTLAGQADPSPFEVAAARNTAPAPSVAPVAPVPSRIGPPAPAEVAPGSAAAARQPVPAVASPIERAAMPGSRLASILSGIEPEAESAPVALPTPADIRAARRAAERKAAEAAAAAAAKDAKAKEVAAARANPRRIWVQVATGANTRALPATWKRIREDNATVLKGLSGYTVPYRATNRLLAGPVKSAAAARALINALARNGVSATSWSSEAGQEILKLAAE